jgi:hypothetical protein
MTGKRGDRRRRGTKKGEERTKRDFSRSFEMTGGGEGRRRTKRRGREISHIRSK